MTLKTFCKINPKYVLIKLHYFFMCGGFAGGLPYVVLLGKNLNINATAIGIALTTFKVLVMITNPLIGSLVDYYQNIKIFLIGLLIAVAISVLGLLLIPPIVVECTNKEDIVFLELPKGKAREHRECYESSEINCTFITKMRNISESSTDDSSKWMFLPMKSYNLTFQVPYNNSSTTNDSLIFEMQSFGKANTNLTKSILFKSGNVSSNCEPYIHVYTSYQFWLYFVLTLIGGASFENSYSLSDVICYEILGSEKQLYGSQRLFGTIGYAIIGSLSGFLNEILAEKNARKDYSPGFYLLTLLVAVDLLLVSKLPVNKAKPSKNMSGDLKRVLGSCEIKLFAVGAIFIGILTTIGRNYEFWYLQDLGASQTLMGATVFVQSAIEITFFLISAWFVKKFGSFNCLVLSFVAFSIRFGLYYFMNNPWWPLAIDTTHGMTFALFRFSITNFASMNAPKGTEATVLGILLGLTAGLGASTGTILGGVALDKYGGRLMFCFASVFSAACAVCFVILPKIIIPRNSHSEKCYEYEITSIEKN